MTCRAIRHDTGQECIPLLLVRRGELTPRQCDHHFKGVTGDCPTCKLEIQSADLNDGSTYAAAMARLKERGVAVAYKRFGYGTGGSVEPWRVCYFGHPPGYWEGVPFRDCQNQDTDSHRINLDVIRRYYKRDFKPEDGYVIKVEPRLRRPGDPPRPYSPDLAIYGPKGERLVAVEYQRSYEAYEKFLERDMMRRSAPESWAAVDWWLDDTQHDPEHPRLTVYERSQMHRTYLSSIPVRHVRCFVDPDTLKLQAEYGRCGEIPPERRRRVERHIEKADLKECSTARIVRQVEGQPEWQAVKAYKEPLRPKSGSDLTFREDLAYSLERERRIAEAVICQQKRIEEQDRRHREYGTKCRLVEEIRSLVAELSILPGIESNACTDWTPEQLRQEIERLSHLLPDAKQARKRLEMLWRIESGEELDGQCMEDGDQDLYLDLLASPDGQEALAKRQAKESAERAEKARRESAETAARAEAQRQADEQRRQWERANAEQEERRRRQWDAEQAEKAEKQRKEWEVERHWHPVEMQEAVRGMQMLKTVLMPGDRLRRSRWHAEEIYQGRTAAGYSTDHHTYGSLEGWQVWRQHHRAEPPVVSNRALGW